MLSLILATPAQSGKEQIKTTNMPDMNSPVTHCHIQNATVSTSINMIDFTNEIYELAATVSWTGPGYSVAGSSPLKVRAVPRKGRVEEKLKSSGFRDSYTTLTAGLEIRDGTNGFVAVYDVRYECFGNETITTGSVSFPATQFWKGWIESGKRE
jgi:hypothetical protein